MEDNAAFDIDPELLAGFVDEALEGLATLDSLFVKLEAEPANLDIINAIFRPVHTVKGNSAFFGLMKVKVWPTKWKHCWTWPSRKGWCPISPLSTSYSRVLTS